MTESSVYLKYTPLESLRGESGEYLLASIILNRPKQGNSFNATVITLMLKLLDEVKSNDKVRVLVFQGEGRHFSSGADLEWMRDSEKLSCDENFHDTEKMLRMFEQIVQLDIPTIAFTKGVVYGGAVGLVACCDIVISSNRTQFYLSETRIGLIPAVILPYLCRKVVLGQLRRYILGPRHFNAKKALTIGLVQACCEDSVAEALLHAEIKVLLEASPDAQSKYKELERHLQAINFQQTSHTSESIALIRRSEMAKAGIDSLREKKFPPWTCRLNNDVHILV